MKVKRCAVCNKRIKSPYTNWSYLTGKPRIVCVTTAKKYIQP